MRRLIGLILLLVFVISIFSGCTTNNKEKARYLKVAEDVALPSMDQHISSDGLSFEVIAATIEGLYSVDADGNLIPAIASKHEVSEDNLKYTFTLRDAKWSNGDPVTAADFVFSWRRLLDPKTASEYNFIGGVAGIKNADAVVAGEMPIEKLGVTAVDEKTLVVELDRPVPYFLSLTSFPTFFPLNEKFVKEKGEKYALEPENLLANGPFKMASWKKGYGFVLDKNPDYYDAASVELPGIDFRVMKDNQTAALKYESKELDVVKLTAELVEKYKNNEGYTKYEAGYLWYAAPNNESKVFSNVNARMALQHAINKKHIVENILGDGSIEADFIVPVKLATGPDGKDFRETAPSKYGVYDVKLANKYWEMAKSELGMDSVKVELLFDDAETIKKTAEFIKEELETNLPGLTVNLKSQPKKNRLELMRKGEFDLGLTRWGPDYSDPLTYLEVFKTGAETNYANYSSDAYDSLVKSASKELAGDAKGRWDAMIKAEKLLLEEEAGVAPIYQRGYSYLVNPKVSGIEFHTVGVPFIYKNVKISE